MKSRRQWNSTLPAPSHPMPRGTPLRSKPRKASEFARIYGSRKRVAWVKARPCVVPFCVSHPCENAHVTSGGTGRKADANTIVPLCTLHHAQLHTWGARTFASCYRLDLNACAAATEAAWQCAQSSGLTPLSAIVPGVHNSMVNHRSSE